MSTDWVEVNGPPFPEQATLSGWPKNHVRYGKWVVAINLESSYQCLDIKKALRSICDLELDSKVYFRSSVQVSVSKKLFRTIFTVDSTGVTKATYHKVSLSESSYGNEQQHLYFQGTFTFDQRTLSQRCGIPHVAFCDPSGKLTKAPIWRIETKNMAVEITTPIMTMDEKEYLDSRKKKRMKRKRNTKRPRWGF